MKHPYDQRRYCFILSCAVAVLLSCSRQEPMRIAESPVSQTDRRISDVAQLVLPRSVRVRGYGIVGHLDGTGSNSCPDQIRAYLHRTIPKATASTLGVGRLIASPNTAVVLLEGMISAGALQSDTFDLKVTALDDSGNCSLQGGWLYATDLRLEQGRSGASSPVVASARGALFLDKIHASSASTKRSGYILGGGRVTSEPRVVLLLNEPSFGMAGAVRNAINRRFGSGTAQALSLARVELSVPLSYRHLRDRFFALVKGIYLNQQAQWLQNRAEYWAGQLVQGNAPDTAEIALEGIGRSGMTILAGLLSHPQERVRLSAARCLGSLGVDHAIEVLVRIATDVNASYRKEAIGALAVSGNSSQVNRAIKLLLQDDDFSIVLETYEKIVAPYGTGIQVEDPQGGTGAQGINTQGTSISRLTVGQSITLDLIPYGRRQAVVATRKDVARIALFGVPIRCKQGFQWHLESSGITVDTRAQELFLTVSREASNSRSGIGPLRCERSLSAFIRKLSEEPVPEYPPGGGLGLAYDEILAVLKEMCDEEVANAEFWAGPLPQLNDL